LAKPFSRVFLLKTLNVFTLRTSMLFSKELPDLEEPEIIGAMGITVCPFF
jgi:hypothetical protein